MAKLKIMIAGNPVLREEAKPVERIDKKLQRLLKDMAETMYDKYYTHIFYLTYREA